MVNTSPAESENCKRRVCDRESLRSHLDALESCIDNPAIGLPEEIFLFASSIVPLVNVDLLIRDDDGRTLLTWREDRFSGAGWHIPGGIIRYKEKIADRVAKVALTELSTVLMPDPVLLAVNEFHIPGRRERAHFISFLYECRLDGCPNPQMASFSGVPVPGQWRWFSSAPADILSCHRVYEVYL
ncbi:MAG: NUDIX domain-containing protein [Chlorobiaceae bacterium]|nr:NUDIX domain-containing protein [Chlorobiaceae bacterium]